MADHRRGETTLALLTERGYGFSIEDVAERAQVHKTTIYRRWPTKPVLVAEAITTMADRTVPPPEDLDPLEALAALAQQVAAALRHPAGVRALRAVAAVAGDDDELVHVAADFFDTRYQLAVDLVQQAQRQGVLRKQCDPLIIWEAMVNPLHVRALTGRPADDHTTAQLVELVLDGARR